MEKYVDDKYALFNGNLMSCLENRDDIFIPAMINGQPVIRISAGCSTYRRVNDIRIAEGIREIGTKAFSVGHDAARSIEIPSSVVSCEAFEDREFWNEFSNVILKRRFNEDDYEIFEHSCLQLEKGRHLIDEIHGGNAAFAGLREHFPRVGRIAVPACREMHALYVYKDRVTDTETRTLSWNKNAPMQFIFRNCRDEIAIPEGHTANRFREKLFRILLNERQETVYDCNAELMNDKEPRTDEYPGHIESVRIVYYDQSDVHEGPEGITVDIHMDRCRVYFPELRKIVLLGKDYYIYCENYLTADRNNPYIRVDYTGKICDRNGNPVLSAIAQKVTAKYKMISMLM